MRITTYYSLLVVFLVLLSLLHGGAAPPPVVHALDFDLSSAVRRAANGVIDNVRSSINTDEGGKQSPSWIEAVTSLATAFKDCPEEHALIAQFIFGFSGADDGYAPAMCAMLRGFVRCIPPEMDSASGVYQAIYAKVFDKGTSRSRAWDFEIVAHLHRNAAAIRWKSLPYNVKTVRIEGPAAAPAAAAAESVLLLQPLDMSDVLGMIPPHVVRVVLFRVDLYMSSHQKQREIDALKGRWNSNVKKQFGGGRSPSPPSTSSSPATGTDEVESLELQDCRIEDSFLESGSWFSLLTRLALVNCEFYVEKSNSESASLPPPPHPPVFTTKELVKHWAAPMELLRTISIKNTVFFPLPPNYAAEHPNSVQSRLSEAIAKAGYVEYLGQILHGKEFIVSVEFVAADASSWSQQHSSASSVEMKTVQRQQQQRQVNQLFSSLAQLKSLKHIHIANVPVEEASGNNNNNEQQQQQTRLVLPSHLEVLALRNVGFTELPDLSQLPESLTNVDFSFNNLTSFPLAQMRASPRVRRISIAGNQIIGGLQTSQLPQHLLELNCSRNLLSGPLDLVSLPGKMETFDVSFNQFSGPVNMRRLPDSSRFIFFNDNRLTGRYDVSRLPLLSVRVMFGNNDWTSIFPKP